MPRSASARRYAQAAFQLALERGELDRWYEDLILLADALSNRDFAEFLDMPEIPASQKTRVINESLGRSVNLLAANLLSLLASRNSAEILPDIVEQYQRMLDAHRGIERGEVISAVPLNDQERQRIMEMLQGLVGKEVRLTMRVDPRILGGFIARVGDHVIDGTAKSRLQAMRQSLVEQMA